MPRQVDSRKKLLETASGLMWRGSYAATSVDQICEACGIKKGSFYHHFESKEQLMIEALEQSWSCYRKLLDEAFTPLVTPLERVKNYMRFERERQCQSQKSESCVYGCPLFSLGAEIGTREPVLRAKVEEILSRTVKYIESALREGHALGELEAPNPKQTAWQVFTLWEGAMTLARIRNNPQPLSDAEDGVLRLLRSPAAASAA